MGLSRCASILQALYEEVEPGISNDLSRLLECKILRFESPAPFPAWAHSTVWPKERLIYLRQKNAKTVHWTLQSMFLDHCTRKWTEWEITAQLPADLWARDTKSGQRAADTVIGIIEDLS